MPLYEYTCTKCHQKHEAIQKFSDPPLKKCPHCQGKLTKDLSLSGFQLKGGGWYKDGYASTSTSSTSSSATPSGNPSSKSSGTATETKKSAPEKKSSK